jgi:TatA/E family protein of Tat protein translocase
MLGTQDLVIGLVIALFFFGAKRLPEMAKSLGKSMQEFKKGVSGDTGDEERVKPATPPPAVATTASHTCGSCQSALEPEWKHCPRCGASSESGSTPGAQPSR